MGFKVVILWTDVALWAMFAALVFYIARLIRRPHLRANWQRVLRDPAALSAGVVLALFLGITALDSLHFRRALADSPAGQQFYETRTESVLDLLLARQIEMVLDRQAVVQRRRLRDVAEVSQRTGSVLPGIDPGHPD